MNHILSVAVILLWSTNTHAEEIANYCHDEETNLQWQVLETMQGTHPDLVNLSKYRTEICSKINSGRMPHEEGTILFEIERERVLERVRSGRF